jgi:hypothetical protein
MKQIEKLLIEEFKKNNVTFNTDFRYDYVDDSFTDVLKSVIGVVEKLNYIRCSTRLKDKERPTFEEWLKDKFIKISDTDYTNKDQNCIWGYYELEDIYKLMN